MKKYSYNLNGKRDNYSLEEIASALDEDKSVLEELLNEQHDDIELACMASFIERQAKQSIQNLLQIYPTRFLYMYKINDLLNCHHIIRDNKRSILNTVIFLSNCNENAYILFDKKTFDTIIVNTEDNVEKPVVNNEELEQIKSVRSLFDNNCDNESTIDSQICFDEEKNKVRFPIKEAEKLLLFLDSHKLPMNYNADITKDLIIDIKNSNSKDGISCYSYIKK